ncbi:cytochrome c [Gemmata sp. G18]|uniref:Cytochrome c n=1 Tax=Gemmata palustris TaxID=2822762 RepID=A0ABS5C053_9BACT|nr:cytochrome c [Gemmata palustris]MBP3959265.1 cytochrome c [Gemmata palustris]
MSTPNPNDAPKTDAPVVPTGGDSVSDLHRAHMIQMNDPVMLTADGVDDSPESDEPGAGGSDSVQGLHEMVMREQAEPRDGFEPIPFWVAVVCGGLLMWGGYYVGANSADFRRDVFDEPDPKPTAVQGPTADPDPQTVDDLKAVGKQKYDAICAACHLPDGKGKPSEQPPIPPLDRSEWVAGDKATPARLSRILLYGLKGPIEVDGKPFSGTGTAMPAHGSLLKDYEIAGVLAHIRNSWSNKADADNAKPAITGATVKAARAKEKDGKRATNGTEQMTAEELLNLARDYTDPPAAKK